MAVFLKMAVFSKWDFLQNGHLFQVKKKNTIFRLKWRTNGNKVYFYVEQIVINSNLLFLLIYCSFHFFYLINL